WEEKLERYHELGVLEIVRFDADELAGQRLRVWDRLENDLVERAVEDDSTECVMLGLEWRVGAVDVFPVGLRLADSGELLSDADEAEAQLRREAEGAERRIAELEAELARKR
ncbi:MAG: Uma2 family endonuclease, partial [Polyangiales bacterium]